jgi:hypothetical protein
MTDTNDQPGGSTGLLDSVTVEDTNAAAAANPAAAEIDHKGADTPVEPGKIPGAPIDRPEWLPENFWNGDKGEANYEAMAKSWGDMRKLVSTGKHKAPDGGKYDTTSLAWAGDVEQDPLAKNYVGWAQKWGISQAAFDELATQVNEMAVANQEPAIDTAAELKALGPNANAVVDGMVNWARGMVQKGIWGADDFEEFKIMGGTANGMRALMKIREAYEGRIPLQSAPTEGAPSKEELYQMVGDPKYKTDAAYRQKVERMFQQYAG